MQRRSAPHFARQLEVVAFDREGRVLGGGQETRAFAPGEMAGLRVRMILSTEQTQRIARVGVTAAYPVIDLAPYER